MIKILNLIVVLLFLVVFVFSVYASYQVVIPSLFNEIGNPAWARVMQAVTPLVLSTGVLVGFLTLKTHEELREKDSRREVSSFFFAECGRRFDEIIDTLHERVSEELSALAGISGYSFVSKLYHVDVLLKDVYELNGYIVDDAYRAAYERRKMDLKRRLYFAFSRLSLNDFVQIRWAGGDVDSRIKNHNDWLEELSKKDRTDEEERQYLSVINDGGSYTPFPSGVSTLVLRDVISFFSDDGVSKEINDHHELGVVGLYFDYCGKYEFDRGRLILRAEKADS